MSAYRLRFPPEVYHGSFIFGFRLPVSALSSFLAKRVSEAQVSPMDMKRREILKSSDFFCRNSFHVHFQIVRIGLIVLAFFMLSARQLGQQFDCCSLVNLKICSGAALRATFKSLAESCASFVIIRTRSTY